MEKPDISSLPRNIEAEQALLGALLANNKAFESISDYLKANHFADPIHARIYDVISKLILRGHVADTITLKNYFEQEGTLNDVGGYKYLIKLAESSSPLTNPEYYAQYIYEQYLRRELISTGYDIVNHAMKEDIDSSASAQIEEAEKRLYDLSDKGDSSRGFVDFAEALSSSLSTIEKAYQREGNISGISTGLDDLDKRTGGLNNSDLIILAGRPAMGKTALATNMAYNVAELMSRDTGSIDPKDRGVAFFSLEMSADQLATRILSSTAGISSQRMRNGDIDNGEFGRIAEVIRSLEKMPLYIDDTPGLTVNAIRNRARRLKRTKGLGLIVIDYIQLITGSSKRGEINRVQELSEISRGLKIMAKELNVPVIALSQLNRGVEQRDDKRPLMSDLRESGSIEQDADIVLFVYRENYYIQNEEPKETDKNYTQEKHDKWEQKMKATKYRAEVIIGKHRHGPTGSVTLSWNGEFAQFGNFIRDEQLPEQIG